MYARYGMTFKDKSLQAPFEECSWYHPDDRWKPSQIEKQLSKTEKANLKILVELRNLRR